MADTSQSEDDILLHYFYAGFEYKTIVSLLLKYHDIDISLTTLNRRLQRLNLKRRGYIVDENVVRTRIEMEIQDSARYLRGYRSIWHTLRLKYHLQVPRITVANILHELDPEASVLRQQRRLVRRRYFAWGPNFSWHVDGYDKLKPYGLPIHGVIDGFSRKILWLNVVKTNNLPDVPAQLFMNCIQEDEGCPTLLRTDGGTENVLMVAAQCYFRRNGSDDFHGFKAYRRGSSPSNQRIESWWSIFRRGSSSWWIDYFLALSAQGHLDISNKLHLECVWFCFSKVLQQFLDEVKQHWNTHRLRKYTYSLVSGVPEILYLLPEESGAYYCKCPPPNPEEIRLIETMYNSEDNSNVYSEYIEYLIISMNLVQPHTLEDAHALFLQLVHIATSE